jgi:hypothetical protein
MTDGGKQSLQEAVSAFRHRDAVPGMFVGLAVQLDERRQCFDDTAICLFQVHALSDAFQALVFHHAADFDEVGLRHAFSRMHQGVCEQAVIRQQQQAFGVVVEAPDSKKPRQPLRPETLVRRLVEILVDRGTPLRV